MTWYNFYSPSPPNIKAHKQGCDHFSHTYLMINGGYYSSDRQLTLFNSYTMATRDLPDIYAQAQGSQVRECGNIYQANPEWPWHKSYIPLWYAHLLIIGEGRQTCIHHITFIQRFANINCGFKLWAQKKK